jgi:hypothetical protein
MDNFHCRQTFDQTEFWKETYKRSKILQFGVKMLQRVEGIALEILLIFYHFIRKFDVPIYSFLS